ncbi:MAG: tetratricopeptide repeat protein [Prevotella sp.]|nr:tetratricopeptide repeat protein [Prevotella sp.]
MEKYSYYNKNDYFPRLSTKIYALRRDGSLDEARQLAEELLQQDSTDVDVQKAYAWTLIDICKREQQKGNLVEARKISNRLSQMNFDTELDEFTEKLVRKIQALRLTMHPFHTQIQEARELSQNDNNDKAWEILTQLSKNGNLPEEAHESYGWAIYRYLRDHITQLDSIQVRTQLKNYIDLHNERPSILHSQILNFALNYSKQDNKFKLISFLKLWNPNNLRTDDFNDSYNNECKTIPSLMSRIAKAIIDYHLSEIHEFIEFIPCRKDDFIEMIKNQFFWKLYRSTEDGISSSTWELFNQYLEFSNDTPASESHSKILGLAERTMKENNTWRFYDFFRRWNPKKLRTADWQEEKGNNGKNYKPLAIKSLKKVKEALKNLSDEQLGDLQWLIDLYGIAIEKIPDDDWNIRSKALLHLRVGQQTEAKNIYKRLCLKLGDKYYIWGEFADCWEDSDVKIAFLCKALSLEKNEDYIGKIRLELARQLIKSKKYANAIVELNQYKKHYAEKGRHIDSAVNALFEQCLSVTPASDNNAALYVENILIAEEYAYEDLPIQYGYVQYVNTEKKVYHIYLTDSTLVYEHYVHQEFEKGDFVKLRLYKKNVMEENKISLCNVQKCTKDEAIENFNCRIVAVDDVNDQRKLFHFVLGPKLISGILHYNQTDLRPSVGDCIKIHYIIREINDKNNPGKQKKLVEVLMAKVADEINDKLIIYISGYLELKYKDTNNGVNPDFAFINDYYVHKDILKKYGIISNRNVNAKAVYTGNNKWKVFEIEK